MSDVDALNISFTVVTSHNKLNKEVKIRILNGQKCVGICGNTRETNYITQLRLLSEQLMRVVFKQVYHIFGLVLQNVAGLISLHQNQRIRGLFCCLIFDIAPRPNIHKLMEIPLRVRRRINVTIKACLS